MDESGEASVGAFRIGPSTLLGRGVALRVLLFSYLWRLRARAYAAVSRVRSATLPVVSSWLHLRNTHGATYEDWARAAKVLDRMSEQVHEADFYDEELIRNRLAELRRRREEGSLRDVVFCMRGDLVRNLGNMCNPELHKGRLEFFDRIGGIFAVTRRVTTYGALHDISHMQRLLRDLTSNLTFQEAYDITGRVLGITVCSPRKNEPPRCLNYLTSPHVVIWSAVTASCAFPGLFEAQELMAKDRFGNIVPFHAPFSTDPEQGPRASKRRWRDGSLEMDLPMMQIKELFNVNHFIVSQTNPHISPLLRMKELVRTYGGRFAGKLARLAELEVKYRCNQILEIGLPLGGLAKLFAQDWEGDVTMVMPATVAQYLKIIQNPTYAEVQLAANQGRRCTWEKLSAIRANCAIELALDESIAVLNHKRRC